MSLYRYSNDNGDVSGTNTSNGNSCSKGCDSESANALKRILSQLDDLNNQDLRLLDDIVERLLCSRSRA